MQRNLNIFPIVFQKHVKDTYRELSSKQTCMNENIRGGVEVKCAKRGLGLHHTDMRSETDGSWTEDFKKKANKGWGGSKIEQQHNGQRRYTAKLTDVVHRKEESGEEQDKKGGNVRMTVLKRAEASEISRARRTYMGHSDINQMVQCA